MTLKDKALELYNEISSKDLLAYEDGERGETGLSSNAIRRIEGAIREARNQTLRDAAALVKDYSWVLPMFEAAELNEISDDAACAVCEQAAQAIEQMIEE